MGDTYIEVPSGRGSLGDTGPGQLVSISDAETSALLAAEALHSAGSECLVFVDGETAQDAGIAEALRGARARIIMYGALPDGWSASEAAVVETAARPYGYDRFLLVLSSQAAFVLLSHPAARTARNASYGGWTAARSAVVRVAETLRAVLGTPGEPPLPPTAGIDAGAEFAMKIMAHYAELLGAARSGLSVNKDDLFSVLDILKAISAKRRAHDILFVFVEQIAKVLKADRCSIVRVWGGERKGHVLASHEDEKVTDLVISLDKYPELRLALETRERVVIGDVARDPLTREFAAELEAARLRSLVVIPIVLFDANVGSLLLRVARRRSGFSAREISFCEIVAEAASNALERAHLFEQIQRTNERLEFLAVTDGLTGLYNHRYFRKRLQEEFDRAVRYGLALSCLIFDVDNFKRINDTHGHLQGDSILREMAVRIIRSVRKSDIVARYGGEEFTVIMPQTPIEGACVEAERLHTEISTRPYQGMPEGQQVTVSIGVVALHHETMLDSDALLRAADNALYNAKRQGKNRIVVGTVEGEKT